MALSGAHEHVVAIAATPLECFTTIIDFESYPEWSGSIEHAAILEHDADGVGRIVEYRLNMRIKTVRYVLEYAYRKPTELTWRSVDGDIQSIEGVYRFRKVTAHSTQATCRQAVELGFWIPGPLRRLAEQTALRQSVTEFKDEVERRLAAAKRSKRQR